MANHKGLGEVVEAELAEIEQRREKAKVAVENLKGSLVGLCLSGGANRSASFSLGFVQALQKIGLWKHIDYLSTTSGGGYLGAYLTSSILKEKQAVTKEHQPFTETDSAKQNAQVRRFIYGGHYLLKPWRLANMYLMGLFFINLAIFSGLLTVCAAVAFLWRCFDYEGARIWAQMLDAGGDFYAPFWPFWVFAVAWLVAWCVSLFRRGGEATGVVARYLLVATFFSLLVGLALLIGNGDIGGWESYVTGQSVSIGSGVWGPIVALVCGGLLPLLSPKRLLQSGLNPKSDWERYVFNVATTALLVGLPMLLVGWLARENISGFNTDPYRPLVAGDVQDWQSLAGMLVDPTLAQLVAQPWANDAEEPRKRLAPADPAAKSLDDKDRFTQLVEKELAFRLAIVNASKQMRRPWVDEELGLKTNAPATGQGASPVTTASAPAESSAAAAENAGEPVSDHVAPTDNKALAEFRRKTAENEKSDEERKENVLQFLKPLSFSESANEPVFFGGLALPADKRNPAQSKEVERYTTPYLTYAAAKFQAQQLELEKAKVKFLGAGQWHRPSLTRYLERVFDIASWKFRHTGEAQNYWRQATSLHQAKHDFALALDEMLRSPAFTETYLTERKADQLLANKTQPVSGELSGLLTKAVLTDETSFSEADRTAAATPPTNIDEWMPHERHQLGRLLLEHDFPTIFRGRDQIRRVVSIHEDQITRGTWFFWSLVVFLIAGMWVDVNSLSLHRYYRNCIAQTFIVPRNVKSPSVPLSDMVTTEYGGPYHLINASVGMIRRGLGEEREFFSADEETGVNDERWVDTFLFSRLYCGSELTNYVDTVAYEQYVQGYTHKIDLAEATAISGAALSPGHVHNWLLAFLMVGSNLSLGQWVPNPRVGKPRTRPRVLALLCSLWKKSGDRPYCFVSDGGHCENLGLVQLLHRRCKLVIAVDASCDPNHDFHDLGRAMRTARVHCGVRFLELEPDRDGNDQDLSLQPILHGTGDSGDPRNTARHFLRGRIRYDDGSEGLLIYVKPCLTGDESADLMQYRNQSPEFPQEPTSDQLFDAAQVEAYRHLGYHSGMELHKLLPRELSVGELWDYDADTPLLCNWLTSTDAKLDRPTGHTTIVNPLSATQAARAATRPIANQILQKMRQKFRSPADIEGTAFRDMLHQDPEFAKVKPLEAVAALQCAVIDRQEQKPEDREFGVWLLRSIEEDDAVPTNITETLEVLAEATKPTHPIKVRLAAIAVLCIVGRGAPDRDFVIDAIAAHRNDPKASIRLAVRNALSNLMDSPTHPR